MSHSAVHYKYSIQYKEFKYMAFYVVVMCQKSRPVFDKVNEIKVPNTK